MTTDEHKAWLASLKVGDKVALSRWTWDDDEKQRYVCGEIRAIMAITKARRFRLGDREFNPDGSPRGRPNSWSGRYWDEMRPADAQARADVAARVAGEEHERWRNKAIYRLRLENWPALPDDTIKAVLALLPRKEPKP
jgi:hypothetical protein